MDANSHSENYIAIYIYVLKLVKITYLYLQNTIYINVLK